MATPVVAQIAYPRAAVNEKRIPTPWCTIRAGERDGRHASADHYGGAPNYWPNSRAGTPMPNPEYRDPAWGLGETSTAPAITRDQETSLVVVRYFANQLVMYEILAIRLLGRFAMPWLASGIRTMVASTPWILSAP